MARSGIALNVTVGSRFASPVPALRRSQTMKRLLAALLSIPCVLLAVAAPAQAAPKDAQGCEHATKAGPIADYCETNP